MLRLRQVWVEVTAGYRLPKPESCPKKIRGLMLECWHETAADRPSFTELTERLKAILTDDFGHDFGDGYLDMGPDEMDDEDSAQGEPQPSGIMAGLLRCGGRRLGSWTARVAAESLC